MARPDKAVCEFIVPATPADRIWWLSCGSLPPPPPCPGAVEPALPLAFPIAGLGDLKVTRRQDLISRLPYFDSWQGGTWTGWTRYYRTVPADCPADQRGGSATPDCRDPERGARQGIPRHLGSLRQTVAQSQLPERVTAGERPFRSSPVTRSRFAMPTMTAIRVPYRLPATTCATIEAPAGARCARGRGTPRQPTGSDLRCPARRRFPCAVQPSATSLLTPPGSIA